MTDELPERWELTQQEIADFNKALREMKSPEQQNTFALAEIARQLIKLNATLDESAGIMETGLNRVADASS